MTMVHTARPGADRAADPTSYKWYVLATTSLGALLAALNTSTLVIALPDLLRSLHIGVLDVTWVLLAYILAQTAAVLTAGRLGDMWGRRRLYVAGFAIFTVMALASGFAGGAASLIVMRSLAGIGGALLVATAGALVTDAFPGPRLGFALGVNGMVLAVGSAVGPILGGWLTTLGWQWVFWFNVPLGVVGTAWSALVLREPRLHGRRQRIDWTGNVLAVTAMTGLLLALSGGGILGWGHPLVVGGAVAFAAFMPLFVYVERRVRDPLLDLSLFRNRLFTIGNVAQLVNGTARMGLLFLLVFYFQGPEQRDPVTAGVLVTPLAALMFLASPVSGWVSDRVGARVPSTLGLVVTAVGLGGLGLSLDVATPYWLVAVWLGLAGAGAGIFQSPNSSSIMMSVPPSQRGIASGVRMLVAFTGSMISIAFVLAIITSSMPPAVMLRIFSGVSGGLDTASVTPFVHGVRDALLVLAALSLVTAPLSLLRGAEQTRAARTATNPATSSAGVR